MRPTALACSLLLVFPISAQFNVRDISDARRMTSVVWTGFSGVQRLAIDYGQPKWRPEYEAAAQARTARDVFPGKTAWTTLQSNVDLQFGTQKLARGRWYLSLHRDASAAWLLSVYSPDKVDAETRGYGVPPAAAPELRVPLRRETDAAAVELLEITLASDKKQRQNVALTFAWGPHRLRTDLVADVDLRVHPGTPEFALSPKDKVTTTASGLQYEPLTPGTGAKPKATDTVEVHYTGWLTDGTLFDSSHARGEPTTFPVEAVVKGFGEGLQLMPTGSTYRFTIPPALAYGERAMGDVIPANSTLVFVVTLLAIK